MAKWVLLTFLAVVPLLAGQWPTTSDPPPPSDSPANQYPDASQTQYGSGSDTPDPADLQHGVARLSIAQGDVNIRRGDNGELTGAVVNAPLMAHDRLETAGGSRAEVQFDAATLVRLAPGTNIQVADLQYRSAQLQLSLGAVIFRVFPGAPSQGEAASQVEIDTPSVGVRAQSPGEYRIAVLDDGTTEITVRSGQLQLMATTGSEQVNAGRTVLVRGDASGPMMQTQPERARDAFDGWSEDRDRVFGAPQSNRYVSADIQGAADLDQYGNWVSSGYGQVWRPQGVASDWSPYSNGQWSYLDYYGWSWIDYSPWGWAPYHYGRWFWNTGYGWCWWPGGGIHRAYWSPALVGFFGFGGRVGIGFGGLGWVALAPYERSYRWWGRNNWNGYGGYHGFAVGSFRNAAIRGGAMTAPYNNIGGGHQRFFAATRGQISGGSAFTGRLPIAANRASYQYSDRRVVESSRFAASQSRGFFHQSPAARPFGVTPASRPNAAAPAYRPNVMTPSRNASGGWNSFGTPAGAGASPNRQAFQSQNQERSGWHDFGRPQGSAGLGFSQQPRSSYQSPQSGNYSRPNYQSQPRYNSPGGAPRQSFGGGPSFHASQPQQHYSAPSAPRGGGGGGSHASGGGGGHRSH